MQHSIHNGVMSKDSQLVTLSFQMQSYLIEEVKFFFLLTVLSVLEGFPGLSTGIVGKRLTGGICSDCLDSSCLLV